MLHYYNRQRSYRYRGPGTIGCGSFGFRLHSCLIGGLSLRRIPVLVLVLGGLAAADIAWRRISRFRFRKFKFGQLRYFRLGKERLIENRRDERLFVLSLLELEMERLERFRRRCAGLRLSMAPAHHGGIKSFLQHRTRAGFDYRFAAHQSSATGLFVEISFDPVSLFGSKET
jgi:hypothetical protein